MLVTKPIVKTLAHHQALIRAAEEQKVLVGIEVHKRWDPIYADAKDRIPDLGHLSFFNAYMVPSTVHAPLLTPSQSQPSMQLDTFRSWAGKSSDISYYLNSHHVDFLVWTQQKRARPIWVLGMLSDPSPVPALNRPPATASKGFATNVKGIETEDTITLTTQWESITPSSNSSPHLGTAIFTSSWIAPKSDVHSQQRFHYMGTAVRSPPSRSPSLHSPPGRAPGRPSASRLFLRHRRPRLPLSQPLFMKYTPDSEGKFAGQHAYGYRSIALFIGQPPSCSPPSLLTPSHQRPPPPFVWASPRPPTGPVASRAYKRPLPSRPFLRLGGAPWTRATAVCSLSTTRRATSSAWSEEGKTLGFIR